MNFFAPAHQLDALKAAVPSITRGDHHARARWLRRFYSSGAYLDLDYHSAELHHRYGITERTLDDCFEMGDSADVLQSLLTGADAQLLTAIANAESAGVLAQWRARAQDCATQPALF